MPNNGHRVILNLKNIGPHNELQGNISAKNNKIGLFAINGSGKTFISRSFRLVTFPNPSNEDSDKLISIGENEASFNFSIVKSGDPEKKLSISLRKGEKPRINNRTGYIFHVFNRDYISENLEELKYKPDGEIEGYILGKEKIDLSNEKLKLEEVKQEKSSLKDEIESKISEAQKTLDKLSVSKNLNEYKYFEFSKLRDDIELSVKNSFSEYVELLNNIKSIPEEFEEIKSLNDGAASFPEKKLQEILETPFDKSTFSDAFKEKIKLKLDFVSSGLSHMHGNKERCPFCKQILEENASKLINDYEAFLKDSEGNVINEIKGLSQGIDTFLQSCIKTETEFYRRKDEYNENKKYLPSLAHSNFKELTHSSEIEDVLNKLKNVLHNKAANIENVFSDESAELLGKIHSFLIEREKEIRDINDTINIFNKALNNIKVEKRELSRDLCKSQYIELKLTLKNKLVDYTELEKDISSLEEDISNKESQHKISKKDQVASTLEKLLINFFGEKYSFNKDQFCFKFKKTDLSNASDVLSEGEKSIAAFCFYLAEIHALVNKQDDYKNLFFIIDDPISSLDFHYVYAVAQSIRNLKDIIGEDRRERFLILTHNLEFFNILTNNRILTKYLGIKNNMVKEIGNKRLMPYEEHLSDIMMVAEGLSEPKHTTPNSARHVLETISRFEEPKRDLRVFCETVEELKDNGFIYALIQDSSHGGVRSDFPYDDELIIRGCKAIIEFINSKYCGQLSVIRSYLEPDS